uniref:Uncharacterized protein n=1 Tax=Romanomermis culicivorax TaxID=13658 RepID=A0A915JE25_ROMCU
MFDRSALDESPGHYVRQKNGKTINEDCSPEIDFREYQLARLASRIENDQLYIVISCKMMYLDRISKNSSEFTSIITKILRFPFEMTLKECRRFSHLLPDKPIDGDLLYLLAKQKRSIKRLTDNRI